MERVLISSVVCKLTQKSFMVNCVKSLFAKIDEKIGFSTHLKIGVTFFSHLPFVWEKLGFNRSLKHA